MKALLSARNTLVLLTCMAIAALFWLLKKLSNTYNSDVRVQVEYVNIPSDKVVIQTLPEELLLQVNGTGWELLRYSIALDKPSVLLDIGQYAGSGRIALQNNRSSLAQQLPYQYDIMQVEPANIPLVLDERSTDTLPVRARTNIQVNTQYGITDSIRLSPQQIVVSGPSSIIDTMTQVPTEMLSLTDVQKDQTGKLALAPPLVSSMTYTPGEVSYAFEVEPFTEASVMVPVTALEVDSTQVMLLNQAVRVAFQVPMDRFADTRQDRFAQRFQVVADFSALTPQDSLAPIQLVVSPPFIRKPALTQRTIKFLWREP